MYVYQYSLPMSVAKPILPKCVYKSLSAKFFSTKRMGAQETKLLKPAAVLFLPVGSLG
jgi:hypothetical protein